jgi:magnesium chelatase family protein
MAEFTRHVLEVLRQPLEEGSVRIARAARTVSFPARFMLIGAMNPCPCGYLGDPIRPCRCTPLQVGRYATRLSGPLRDRIDLTVAVAAVPPRDLDGPAGEPSPAIRTRVVAARARQAARDGVLNTRLAGRSLRARTRLDAAGQRLLASAMTRLSLTARAHDRLLRTARTIADLDGSDEVDAAHLAEALQFRGDG